MKCVKCGNEDLDLFDYYCERMREGSLPMFRWYLLCRACRTESDLKAADRREIDEHRGVVRLSITEMTWALEFGYVGHEKGLSLLQTIEKMNQIIRKKDEDDHAKTD
jgi:hypothetical protein